MAKYKSKINKIRTYALGLVFLSFLVMYIGILFKNKPIIMGIFMFLGLIIFFASTIIFFRIGILSARATQVICPNCKKPTKILGKVDICMHCNEPLTLDPKLEGKEFDEKYNRKKNQKNNHKKKKKRKR